MIKFNQPGDLTYGLMEIEQRAIYETTLAKKPTNIYEVGTFRGGGSTLCFSAALNEIGSGHLFTCEANASDFSRALELYTTTYPTLRDKITFLLGESLNIYPLILEENKQADIVFLDGCDNPQTTMDELNMFMPYMSVGSLVICHDWKEPKTAIVKPYFQASEQFNIIQEIITTPHGLAIMQKIS